MNTDRLLEQLAHDLRPAPALRQPWARAAVWLFAAGLYLALLATLMTSRADVAANRGSGWLFLVSQGTALATAATAAIAAFASTVPGFSSRVAMLLIIAATTWVGTLLGAAASEWGAVGGADLWAPREWLCVVTIVLGGAPLWVTLAFMLRQGAPLAPRTTTALGALAAAAVANVAACVSEPHPSSIVTLLWHGGTIVVVTIVAASAARYVMPTWKRRHALVQGG
jgi:hypothetical protein